MKPSQYTELAQRTSAPITPEIMERFANPRMLTMMVYKIRRMIQIAEILDHIKKHVFYGKPITIEPDYPSPANYFQILKTFSNENAMKIFHGILGKASEIGELLQAMENMIESGTLDVVNVKEELGDDQWYNAELLKGLGCSFEEVWTQNIAKLAARYGSRFSDEAALNRNLVNEREVLEGEHDVVMDAINEASLHQGNEEN